jgi:hypothetical protein
MFLRRTVFGHTDSLDNTFCLPNVSAFGVRHIAGPELQKDRALQAMSLVDRLKRTLGETVGGCGNACSKYTEYY